MNPNSSLSEITGYFGPETITWRLYREPIMLLGGIRALLLQVAHPSVAEGVARYSQFKTDPFGRGYRTFSAMATIYFGSRSQADKVSQKLWRIHSAIRGEKPVPFAAIHPELLLWVQATLVNTTLEVFEQTHALNLPPDWQTRFYEESKIAAGLLGIPADAYPPDLPAFRKYFDAMLHSDVLGSEPECLEVAQAILQHPKAPQRAARFLAAGWLPPVLCQRLGIALQPGATQKLMRFLARAGRAYRFIPTTMRLNPAFHQARYRIAKFKGEKTELSDRFFQFLASKLNIPFGLEIPNRL